PSLLNVCLRRGRPLGTGPDDRLSGCRGPACSQSPIGFMCTRPELSPPIVAIWLARWLPRSGRFPHWRERALLPPVHPLAIGHPPGSGPGLADGERMTPRPSQALTVAAFVFPGPSLSLRPAGGK